MSLKVERGRTLARSQALQIIFQAEALDLSVVDVLAGDYLISKGPLDAYAIELARGCHGNIDRIDYALRSVSQNWSLYRMPGTDRNLLRLAVYEMCLLGDGSAVDDAVVINEAVEIAKAYGTDESARFVNGVLGRISRLEELPVPPASDEEFSEETVDPFDVAPTSDGEEAAALEGEDDTVVFSFDVDGE